MVPAHKAICSVYSTPCYGWIIPIAVSAESLLNIEHLRGMYEQILWHRIFLSKTYFPVNYVRRWWTSATFRCQNDLFSPTVSTGVWGRRIGVSFIESADFRWNIFVWQIGSCCNWHKTCRSLSSDESCLLCYIFFVNEEQRRWLLLFFLTFIYWLASSISFPKWRINLSKSRPSGANECLHKNTFIFTDAINETLLSTSWWGRNV